MKKVTCKFCITTEINLKKIIIIIKKHDYFGSIIQWSKFESTTLQKLKFVIK